MMAHPFPLLRRCLPAAVATSAARTLVPSLLTASVARGSLSWAQCGVSYNTIAATTSSATTVVHAAHALQQACEQDVDASSIQARHLQVQPTQLTTQRLWHTEGLLCVRGTEHAGVGAVANLGGITRGAIEQEGICVCSNHKDTACGMGWKLAVSGVRAA